MYEHFHKCTYCVGYKSFCEYCKDNDSFKPCTEYMNSYCEQDRKNGTYAYSAECTNFVLSRSSADTASLGAPLRWRWFPWAFLVTVRCDFWLVFSLMVDGVEVLSGLSCQNYHNQKWRRGVM